MQNNQNNADRFTLQELGLLDAPAQASFDNLTRLASTLLETPVSLVSIIDTANDRQYFKSQLGLPEPWASRRQTPLSHSFCQHVVNRNSTLVVSNAPFHPLVSNNRAVDELGVVSYLGAPLYSPSGSAIGALCVISDKPRRWSTDNVHLLKQLAACCTDMIELNRAIATSAQLQAEQQEFTYALSHDLKAPTNTLALLHQEIRELLHTESNCGIDVDELLDLCGQTTRRMDELIYDVTQFVYVDGQEAEHQRINLNRLVHSVLQDLKADIQQGRARVEVADLPAIHGNETQMRVLLQNLIANALKYHRPGVAPLVCVGAEPGDRDGMVDITIRDNGIGIPSNDHENIFKLFKRLHMSNEYTGIGLGLTLCRRIVQKHGGQLRVESIEGEGSTFTVRLPEPCRAASLPPEQASSDLKCSDLATIPPADALDPPPFAA